jgi:NADPH:quinone reductase
MVVNHHKNLVDEVHLLGYQYVDYILELNNIDQHWNEMSQLIKPDGNIVSITENKKPINLKTLTRKRVNFAWEWMFSKSYYSIDNSISQKEILDKVAEYLDSGKIKSTVTKELSPINAENIRKAHQAVESGHMMGKVVITNNE